MTKEEVLKNLPSFIAHATFGFGELEIVHDSEVQKEACYRHTDGGASHRATGNTWQSVYDEIRSYLQQEGLIEKEQFRFEELALKITDPYIKPNDEFIPEEGIKREAKFGGWTVSLKGDLHYERGYFIDCDSLKESDWILHLFGKAWINWNDFIPAYFQACINKGITAVKIDITRKKA